MRVTAGKAKGLRLKSPGGAGVRPTSGLVKSALFSMLAAIPGRMERVVDLYSGTGALGIEALSRGAEWVDFVDRDPRNCALIRENLGLVGYEDKAHVYCSTVDKALSFLAGGYTLVLADPPYEKEDVSKLLTKVAQTGLVEHDGIVAIEHSTHDEIADGYDGLKLIKSRRYGETCISLYQKEQTS